MRWLGSILLVVAFGGCHALGREVLAHFMLSNTLQFSIQEYRDDMRLAQDAGIDAFAVNMGANDATSNYEKVDMLFRAAEQNNFKIIFSFDYAGNGVWPRQTVLDYIHRYAPSSAYMRRGSQPLVSTFEGSEYAGDWRSIKAETGCFFMPDYSSIGAERAWGLGVADGLFSWDAWPNGPGRKNTDGDVWYMNTLNGAPYMMAVSPWFYTNLPNYNKNWLWSSDTLWYDRWNQVLALRPEYVQIVTWNDFGEAHHIGPIRDKSLEVFGYGGAPFNYAVDRPHDGWRTFLGYLSYQYKTSQAEIWGEDLIAWYRLTPGNACNSGGTTGNSASHGQQLYSPQQFAQDRVMFSALLWSNAEVYVSIGGDSRPVQWEAAPGSGLYFGTAPFDGRTGEVVVTVRRGSTIVSEMRGAHISRDCSSTGGFHNWNPWVGVGRRG